MDFVNHTSFYAMGTRCHMVLPGLEEEEAEVIFRHVRSEIMRIELMLSRFKPDSEISRINREASSKPCYLSKEMYKVLNACMFYYEKTDGCFDITLRPVLQYWKDHPQGSADQAASMLKEVGMDKISLDEINKTIRFHRQGLEIDLGGFGKGYALELINSKLLKYGVRNAFLSLGESSVLTLGNHPAGDCWKVGIKDWITPQKAVHTYHVRYGSVSTSANFFVDDEGKLVNHRHVIHPVTGVPVDELVMASVCSASALLSEVMSTAFLVMPPDQVETVKKELPELDLLRVDYTSGEAVCSLWE